MNRLALAAPALTLAFVLAAAPARAQSDAAVDAAPAAGPDAAADGAGAAGESGDRCVADPLPADRAPQVSVTLDPPAPRVGDRVLVTYHFRFRGRDRVEFDPDVVAFQQPAIEMEYARDQPERTRGAHADPHGAPGGLRSDPGGWLASDVVVAVQPFKVADVVIRSLPARFNAGDEIARICTPEVRFRARSVFGNDPHPLPRDVTPPEEVRRDAFTLRQVALGLDALFLAVVGTLGVTAWVRGRPKPVVPPPPPRHPYVVAVEGLDAIARSDLLVRGLTKDYYDAISDVARRYLGGVRGFDAIEMTTGEVLATLRKNPLAGVTMIEVERLLGECDLVKFARYLPSHEECEEVLKSAYSIVQRGRPMVIPAPGVAPPVPPTAPPTAPAPGNTGGNSEGGAG